MNFDKANIVFFLLSMGMYIFMFIGGNMMKRSKNKRQYWATAVVPILAFTLNMGLRWGRGTDYNNGYYTYERIASGYGNADEYEPLWRLTISTFRNVFDVPWQVLVIALSFFLVYALIYFMRNHKEIAEYALPIFAFLAFPSENLIRWFFSFSFILMGLYHLERKQYGKYLVFVALGGLTHYASVLISVPLFLLFLFTKKKALLHPWISICMFVVLFFFFKTSDMLAFVPMLQVVEVEGNFSQYQANIDDVLTNNLGDFEGGLTGTSLLTMPLLLFLGYKILGNRERLIPYYNIMMIGIVLMPALSQIQMTYRVVLLFELFQFLFWGYILRDVMKKNVLHSKVYVYLTVIMLLVFMRSIVVQPFVKDPNQTYYVWDANGRKTL